MTRHRSNSPTNQPTPAVPATPAITRRGLLAAGAATAATVTTPIGPASAGAARPNIIVINCDDLATSLYESSSPLVRTLESQGRRFLNAIASVPSCGPTRATLLTGRYPHNHGVLANDKPDGGWSVFAARGNERDNLATRLNDAGYITGLIGKYINDYEVDAIDHVPPGWNDWHAWAGRGKYDRYLVNDNGVVSFYDVRKSEDNYETDRYGILAQEFIAANARSGPFFLYIAPHAPHMPARPSNAYRKADAPATGPRTASVNEADVSDKPGWIRNIPPLSPALLRRSDKRFRDQVRSMMSVDDLVRGVLQALDTARLRKNTWIFFTSDNGFFYGEHRVASGKGSLYEEGIRVPFVAIGPGCKLGRTGSIISTVDIAPTILDLAGVAAPDLDGRSFAPLLREKGTVDPGAPALVQYGIRPYQPAPAAAEPAPSTIAAPALSAAPRLSDDPTPRGGSYYGIRGSDWTFIHVLDTNEFEMYDLRNDPYQLSNVYPRLSPTAQALLKATLAELTTCKADTCRSISAAIPPTMGLWYEML